MLPTSTANATTPDAELPKLLPLPSVMRMTGLGRSTIYRMMAAKTFPCPVQLGLRRVAWRRADLDTWSDSLPVITH